MRLYYKTILSSVAVVIAMVLTSCEEVIEIDLNSANPVLVAEGVMENGTPAWMKLSYTTDYFDAEQTRVEDGATVTISDNAGNSEVLEYVSDGLYQGKDVVGHVNQNYNVTVVTNGKTYEANSTLYPATEILSASFEENSKQKPGEDKTYVITVNFKDDTSVKNFYLFKYLLNGESETNSYYLVSDAFYENTGEIEYSPFHFDFDRGDSVLIELYSIDEETYAYYSALSDAEGGMMAGSSTPFNPKSNFGSDVLGYFAAWSKVEYTTTVE